MDGFDVIHRYTRREALADGVLIDVTPLARECGFRHPFAITAAVQAEVVAVPEGVVGQTETGRLWDLLFMLALSLRSSPAGASELRFTIGVRTQGGPEELTLKAHCGPGDDGGPCITVMLPDED